MKRTFKIKDLIKAMKENDRNLYTVVDYMDGEHSYIPGINIDKGLIKTIEDKRDSLVCDVFAKELPEPGWSGAGLDVLIKPEYHELIKVNGEVDDIQLLRLMQLAGIKKIVLEVDTE